ncbi:MAG: hypothetical protein COA99_16225 [Moraxellaceae bacterium]|nr:MAG: hypothetical protein COA99_16225 [Moraxellaceae bacterium]
MDILAKLTTLSSLSVCFSLLAIADDNHLKSGSIANFNVNLTIAEQLILSKAASFSFINWTAGNLDTSTDICIYHNGDGRYKITISDDSAASGFNLEDSDNLNAVPITVNFNDERNTAGNTLAAEGIVMNTQTGANASAADCGTDGSTANLQILILDANLSSVPKGSYDSEITVFVEPS